MLKLILALMYVKYLGNYDKNSKVERYAKILCLSMRQIIVFFESAKQF